MRMRDFLILGLIIVQIASLAYFTQAYVFPAVMLVLSAIAATGLLRFPLPRKRRIVPSLLIGIGFALKWRFFPDASSQVPVFAFGDYGAMKTLAQFLIAIQILDYFVIAPRRNDRPVGAGLAVLFCGAVVMAATANVLTATKTQHRAALALAGVFTTLFALYCMACRLHDPKHRAGWGRRTASAFVLAVALGAGAAMAVGLNTHLAELDQLVARLAFAMPPGATPGFSGHVALGSVAAVQSGESNRVMLRARAEHGPGYCRGLAFESFDGRAWSPANPSRTLRAEPIPPPETRDPEGRASVFALRTPAAPGRETIEIAASSSLGRCFFAPLETLWLSAATDALNLDENETGTSGLASPATRYRLITGTAIPERLDPERRDRYLQTPDALDPRIRDLAVDITKGQDAAIGKIAAVTKFFHANFKYRFGIDVPPDADPLTYFLTERPPAHCEYFAAGAAVLLRLSGVPCRYVTGFVVGEWNSVGSYWIARNRDAHAWVEAWDDERGAWTTVEATPAAGVPDERRASTIAAAFDAARFAMRRAIDRIRDRGVLAIAGFVAAAARALFRTPWGWGILALAGSAWFIRRAIHRRPARRWKTPPEIVPLHRLLRAVDRSARRHGLDRRLPETLLQFARRIEGSEAAEPWRTAATAWYRAYAAVRYRPPFPADALDRLRDTRPQ